MYNQRIAIAFYTITCLAAALCPLVTFRTISQASEHQQVVFPKYLYGKMLTQLPMSEREKKFALTFPGKIRRFSDGSNEIIIRYLTKPTRKLHPSSDCFRGLGYEIKPLPVKKEIDETLWSCFQAKKAEDTMRVCEYIYDEQAHHWPDVYSWYWSTFLGESEGPWWAISVAQRVFK